MFLWAQNYKINHFYSISKSAKFGVLQFYPHKMNLILEIRKMMIKTLEYTLPLDLLHFLE